VSTRVYCRSQSIEDIGRYVTDRLLAIQNRVYDISYTQSTADSITFDTDQFVKLLLAESKGLFRPRYSILQELVVTAWMVCSDNARQGSI